MNTCKKCGCDDAYPSLPPCPTPVDCPNPQPCAEFFDAQCVIYTGDVLTSGITVEQAIDELATSTGALLIPNLKVGTLEGDVHVSLDFYNSTEWLNHNPKIFLFRTKNKKRPNDNKNFKGRPSQFVHTTHMNGGGGSKWFQGSLTYNTDNGGLPILRHTEFNITETIPYKRFNLAAQGMSPYEWITYTEKNEITCPNTCKRQALQSDVTQYNGASSIGINSDDWNKDNYCFSINSPNSTYKDISFSNQKIHFKLAIVIDNPNPTSDKPYLIGPMSDAFVLRFRNATINNSYALFTNDYINTIMT